MYQSCTSNSSVRPLLSYAVFNSRDCVYHLVSIAFELLYQTEHLIFAPLLIEHSSVFGNKVNFSMRFFDGNEFLKLAVTLDCGRGVVPATKIAFKIVAKVGVRNRLPPESPEFFLSDCSKYSLNRFSCCCSTETLTLAVSRPHSF